MKKRLLYPLILILLTIALYLIADIFGFEPEISIYVSVGIVVTFFVIIGLLLKIIQSYKGKSCLILLLYWPITMLVLGIIFIWIFPFFARMI